MPFRSNAPMVSELQPARVCERALQEPHANCHATGSAIAVESDEQALKQLPRRRVRLQRPLASRLTQTVTAPVS